MRTGLLTPTPRGGRIPDFASRQPLIAHQRRRRARPLPRIVRALGLGLGIALGGAALAVVGSAALSWLRATPLLAVAAVEVTGASALGEAAIRAAAGVDPGTNLLALDVDAVIDRVEALPGVRSARVIRHLPRRLVVQVEEREPFALVNPVAGDRLLWVDVEGHLVSAERRPGAPPMPILSGVGGIARAPDQPAADDLRAGLTLLRAVERAGGRVADRVSEIDVGPREGPVLYLVDGTAVRMGTEAWDERLARLDGVLAELDRRGERVAGVDLRFRDQVVLTPGSATLGAADHRGGPGRGTTR
jgi:cell division protein FtsQ